MRVKRLLGVDICNGAFSFTAVMLSAALALSGCLKPGVSRMDSIRTGNGDSMRYMVPIAVKQDDGSGAYCVYVARPNSDMSFFENLGPGRTDGATPVTKNAIPQGEFIQNLRDPEIMKDLGGLGNDMVNDLFTAGSAWMLSSTGLLIGAGAGGIGRGSELGAFRKDAQKLTSQLLEMDSIIDGELKTSYDDLGKLLLNKKATPASVNQLKRVFATAKPGSQSLTFYAAFFEKYMTGSGGLDRGKALEELLGVLNTPTSRNARRVSRQDAETLLDAIGAIRESPEASRMTAVLGRMSALEFQAGGVFKGLLEIRQRFSAAQTAARSSADEFTKVLASSRAALVSLGSEIKVNFSGRIEELYGKNSVRRLIQLADGAAPSSGAANSASFAAKEAAGRAGIFARKPEIDRGRALGRLGEALPEQQLKQMVAANADEAVEAAVSTEGKNLFANACMRGPGGWKYAGMAFCGLAIGAGSFGVKKLLFEPATEPIKREQVAQSFEFNETVQEVNDETFRRLEATIASFKSETTALSCQ
jgi:hypothetical protein